MSRPREDVSASVWPETVAVLTGQIVSATLALEEPWGEDSVRAVGRQARGIAGLVQAWKPGTRHTSARISFATPELLWEVLTAKRWELLKALSTCRS